MKQYINLYHASLKPTKELLSSGRLLWLLFIIILACAIGRGGYEYAMAALTKNHNQIVAEQQILHNRVVELATQINRQRPDRTLLRRTERVDLEIESRRALLAEFNRRGKIRRDNLAPVLQELAAIHVEGLWLTRVNIQSNGVELEGRTVEAGLIPRWMANFERASTLAGHKFSVVELRRDSGQVLNFALLSKPKASQLENGGQMNQFEDQIKAAEIDEKLIPKI